MFRISRCFGSLNVAKNLASSNVRFAESLVRPTVHSSNSVLKAFGGLSMFVGTGYLLSRYQKPISFEENIVGNMKGEHSESQEKPKNVDPYELYFKMTPYEIFIMCVKEFVFLFIGKMLGGFLSTSGYCIAWCLASMCKTGGVCPAKSILFLWFQAVVGVNYGWIANLYTQIQTGKRDNFCKDKFKEHLAVSTGISFFFLMMTPRITPAF